MGVTAQAGNLLPRGIKDQGDGKAEDAHFARKLSLGVAVEGEVIDADFAKEFFHRGGRIAACGDGHDLERIATQLALQVRQHGHFHAARRAPCGPEVQDHVFALIIGEVIEPPSSVVKGVCDTSLPSAWKFSFFMSPSRRALSGIEIGRHSGVCTQTERHIKECETNELHFPSEGCDMTKTSNAMWGGRFAAGPDAIMEAINASIGFDKRLAAQDIAGSRAHAAMLAATGIISDSDAEAMREGLLTVLSEIETGRFEFSTALEDIHMNVEARLKEIIGEPAGRLHTGRSRNDQVATDFKLWVRDQLDAAEAGLVALIQALLAQAEAGADWVMPGFTHLQTAQPVTWGHHMMAYVEMFGRDLSRVRDARARMNECPLGRRRWRARLSRLTGR